MVTMVARLQTKVHELVHRLMADVKSELCDVDTLLCNIDAKDNTLIDTDKEFISNIMNGIVLKTTNDLCKQITLKLKANESVLLSLSENLEASDSERNAVLSHLKRSDAYAYIKESIDAGVVNLWKIGAVYIWGHSVARQLINYLMEQSEPITFASLYTTYVMQYNSMGTANTTESKLYNEFVGMFRFIPELFNKRIHRDNLGQDLLV